jgi:hypothetical protein
MDNNDDIDTVLFESSYIEENPNWSRIQDSSYYSIHKNTFVRMSTIINQMQLINTIYKMSYDKVIDELRMRVLLLEISKMRYDMVLTNLKIIMSPQVQFWYKFQETFLK